MLSLTFEQWSNSQWAGLSRRVFTYDPQGNVTTELTEEWSNGLWIITYRDRSTYNADGTKNSYLSQRLSNSEWVNDHRWSAVYDAQGKLLAEVSDIWLNDQWMNSDRFTYTYDASGNMVSELHESWLWGHQATSWRYTYSYDAAGNQLSELVEEGSNGQWMNYGRLSFTYGLRANKLTFLDERWTNGEWVNFTRENFTYDVHGNLISGSRDDWVNGAWTPALESPFYDVTDSAGNNYSNYPARTILLHYKEVREAEIVPNLVQNPGFESGTEPRHFYTSGGGNFSDDAAGAGSAHAANVDISAAGENVQLYQAGLALKAHARYRLSFNAYSSTGHRLSVFLHKHGPPCTDYGLEDWSCNLGTTWKTFMTEFTSENIVDTVSDARLRFWFAPFAKAGDQYFIDDVELIETEPRLITNGDFEWGTNGWEFFTNGNGSFATDVASDASSHVAQVKIETPGSNTQLYQSDVELAAGTPYRLSFRAYSRAGHALSVYLHKHAAPYTSYGLSWEDIQLGTSWQTFTKDFTATGFAGKCEDARLRFWLSPFAAAGDEYYFDDVTLTRLDGGSGSVLVAGTESKDSDLPKEFALSQNYPNPFNPRTVVSCQ
jgi:hypothetical protein